MEHDAELFPKRDIPTESEFARLLCDKTFVDYLNVYLSLPVFSQRLLYKFSEQNFELDPPIKRTQYRLDRVKLMRWVRTKRAPFFFKSDLYLDYLLCKQLQKTQLHLLINYGSDTASAKEKMMDHCLMTHWLKRVSSMRKFRFFISNTAGENLVLFWMEAEKFRRSANNDAESWETFYRKMESKYFKSRDLKLPGLDQITRLKQMQSRGSDQNMKQTMNRDTFIIVQGFILKSLQNYWVPRYLIHCKQRYAKFPQTTLTIFRPDCYAIKVRSLSEVADLDESEEDPGEIKTSDPRSLHTIRKGQLMKQSVGNLMTMFSSTQVRRSELSTLLKIEDTGETLKGKSDIGDDAAGADDDNLKSKGQDWLTEEFPLPAISEESLSYQRSQRSSPCKSTPSPSAMVRSQANTPSVPPDVNEEEEEIEEVPPKSPNSLSRPPSRRNSARRSPSVRPTIACLDEDRPRSARPRTRSPVRQSGDGLQVPTRTTERTGSADQRLRVTSSSRRGSRSSSAQRRHSQTDNASVRSEGKLSADEIAEVLYNLENKSSDESSSSASPSPSTSEEATEKKPERPPRSGKKKSPEVKRDEVVEDHSDVVTSQTESTETASEMEEIKTPKDKGEGKHRGTIADLTKYRRLSDTQRCSSRNSSSSSTSVGHSSVSSGSMISISKRRMPGQPSGGRQREKQAPKRRTRSQSVEFRLGDFARFINTGDEKIKKGVDEITSSSESIKSPKVEADIVALRALQKDREKRKKERMKRQMSMKRKKRSRAQTAEPSINEIDVSTLGQLGGTNEANELVDTLKKLAMRRKGAMSPLASINKNALKKLQALHAVSVTDNDRHEKTGRGKRNAELAKQTIHVDYSDLSFEQKLVADDRRLVLVSTLPEAHEFLIETEAESMYKMLPSQVKALPAIPRVQTFTVSIDKPRFVGYNLGEPNYRMKIKLLMNAVLSDKLAGWPWVKFLNRYSYFAEVRYIMFWHAAQEYINLGIQNTGSQLNRLRQRVAFQLINDFLKPTSDEPLRLGRLLTAELLHQLPAQSGDELLMHAQDLACDAVREAWTAFQRDDTEAFLGRTSVRKNAQQRAYPLYASPPLNMGARPRQPISESPQDPVTRSPRPPKSLAEVLAEARKGCPSDGDGTKQAVTTPRQPEGDTGLQDANSVAPHRMMRAVELCSGVSFIGSCDENLGEPSDPEDESDDEGSLKKKHIVVFRKRKIKISPRQKYDDEEVRDPNTPQMQRVKRLGGPSDSLHSTERDLETMKSGVCRAIRKGGKTIYRPSRPRSFMEVLHDQGHFEFFRRHLQVEVGNELPLSFWNSVEQLRQGNLRDPKVRQSKTQAIVKKYFNKSTNFGADLASGAEIIQDIPNMDKVTPQMLMSAQTCVAKSMEDKWYGEYKETYTEEPVDEKTEEAPAKVSFGQKGKTRYMWGIFITNVCHFRRLLMTPWLLSLFKEFLGKEVLREVEKQKVSGIISKKIIGGKVVNVDKLQNDLCFWAEVERFKQLADNASRAAAAGTYTLEDEEFLQKKALAIIDVFLDSFVAPRVQINVPQEIAEDIIDIAQHGIIERGLFHDAALHTFTVLLYCWKKYNKERLSYRSMSLSAEEATLVPPQPRQGPSDYLAPGEFGPPRTSQPLKKKVKKIIKPSTPLVCGIKIKTIVGDSSDEPPRMHFTIENGVQLILPPKARPEQESAERYRSIMQTLIESGHEEELLQLFQKPASLGLGPAQQRRLSRSLGLPFPNMLRQKSQ